MSLDMSFYFYNNVNHYRLSVFTFNTQYRGIYSSCKEMFEQGLPIYDILLINVHEKHELKSYVFISYDGV